jgi:SNF2 family DNA or RNA helicase
VNEADVLGIKARIIPYGMPVDVYGRVEGLFVTHYEAIRNADTLSSLAKRTWDMVIVDEAHRIKNRSAQQTKSIKMIQSHRKVALTGTPMEKSPSDLWSILNWLHPEAYRSYWEFFNTFVASKDTPFGRKAIGVKNETRLAQRLANVMIRRTKKEVEKELPPRITQLVPIIMTDTQQEQYSAIDNADDIVVKVENESMLITSVLAQIVKLQQVTSCPRILNLRGAGAKIEWVIDWVKDNPSTQVVLFTKFRKTAELLHEELGNYRCDLLIGGVSEPPEEFLAGHKQCLVGTIDAMGEGLNLQIADVAIFVDMHWSTLKMTQAVDRIHRIGITAPKLIYYLVANNTVDELIVKALEHKWNDIELVMNAVRLWKGRQTDSN